MGALRSCSTSTSRGVPGLGLPARRCGVSAVGLQVVQRIELSAGDWVCKSQKAPLGAHSLPCSGTYRAHCWCSA